MSRKLYTDTLREQKRGSNTDVVYIDRELLERLEELIPEPRITPGTPMESVMYNAGKRSVIHWIKENTIVR